LEQFNIFQPEFIGSYVKVSQCPQETRPEYAFIGRSNVGKSSLINMLTGRKKLAKTSSTPGKTRTINFFLNDNAWYLVDLPGYGFAKVSKNERESWGEMIQQYLIQRKNLLYTFILIDARLDAQKSDLDFINWMGSIGLPFCILFTKSDKLTKNKLVISLDRFRGTLSEYWSEIPPFFVTSALNSTGRQGILDLINRTNEMFYERGSSSISTSN